ncbi:MAG: serine/threonine protein kinase, partial [Nannocystaceae bacterium]|nr:serine/threonine protein kinase [Nannocystaceae bacterium]
MRSLPGTTLEGRYHVLEMIGEGGMGHVFLAEHVTLGRKVAIKVLREELALEPANVERFFQEAQAAASIHHPNVVDVTDFGRASNGLVYFVMEHLVGEELTAMMHRHGSLPWPSAQAIILQVVRGLRATHEQGVVYRDLKPANIFLTRSPEGSLLVKLLDFGIAKHTGNTARPRTKPNSVFGTARYMSPEQAAGKEVDGRSDIYATGVVLYELLAGRAPFESDNYMEVVRCHVADPIPKLREVAPQAQISEVVEALVMRALEKDPAKRFHDMAEFEAAINAASMDDATRMGVGLGDGLGAVQQDSFDDVDHTMIWDAEQGRVARESPGAPAPEHVDATMIRPRPDFAGVPTPTLSGRSAARVVVAGPGAPPRRSTVIASHPPSAPAPAPMRAAGPEPMPPPMQDF